MKKYLKISLVYAIFAMIGGVFYREFTKFNDYTGVTTLGKVHTHLFLLGMIVFMIVALFAKDNKLEEQKSFRVFMYVYNIGIAVMISMMILRGVVQVIELNVSNSVNVMISGVAGLGHIAVGVGIVLLIISLMKVDNKKGYE
ncbi:MAG: DUF2871 domain-containing protein [Eubacteriales bacterium]|nr:DUF2871 domain-containing protein [Eubacteriales bacterium]